MEASLPRNVLYAAAFAAPDLRPLKGGWLVGEWEIIFGTDEEKNVEEEAQLRQLHVAQRRANGLLACWSARG